jgi:hypothetical protein
VPQQFESVDPGEYLSELRTGWYLLMRRAVIAVLGATLAVPFLAVATAPQAYAVDRCTPWYGWAMDQYNLCEQHSAQAAACTYGTERDGYTCCEGEATFCPNPKPQPPPQN